MERRQSRFRFPWSARAAANPTPTSQRSPRPPATQTPPSQPTATQTINQPTTATSPQRPPFRPLGTAPTQSVQESQPSSPSHTATQSRAASQPASPSRAGTQTRAASQLPSPSHTSPQPSPSRASPQPRPASQPSSTSRTTSQPSRTPSDTPEPTDKRSSVPSTAAVETINPSPSPPSPLQTTTQESSQPPQSSTEGPPPEKEELKPAASQPQPGEAQPETEIMPDTLAHPQNLNSIESNLPPNGMATQPSNASGPAAVTDLSPAIASGTPTPPQKSDSPSISANLKPLSEQDEKSKETTEEKESVLKANGVASEEANQTSITELHPVIPGANAQTKEQQGVKFQTEQKQQEQEVPSTKEMLTTSGSNQKSTKTMIPPTKDKNMMIKSRQKPATFNGYHVPMHKDIKDDISKVVNELATVNPKHLTEEKLISVITLAGENRGASMHIGSESATGEGTISIHRGYKMNPGDSDKATTDGEGSSKNRKSEDANTKEDKATKAYTNSNIQAINNSIMFNSSITERNPGVQLVFCHNPTEPVQVKSKRESLETHKVAFNATPVQKLTYEPTIRRRCLRGLFMESSDSDPENPGKHRPHGCRYGYSKESTNNKKDVI